MKKNISRFVVFILICSHVSVFCGIGQSAIITLVLPYGARQYDMGVFRDKAGSRTECHFGLGGSWLNHLNFDWFYIYSPRKSIARDKQWGISFSFHNIFNWSDSDFQWWLSNNKN